MGWQGQEVDLGVSKVYVVGNDAHIMSFCNGDSLDVDEFSKAGSSALCDKLDKICRKISPISEAVIVTDALNIESLHEMEKICYTHRVESFPLHLVCVDAESQSLCEALSALQKLPYRSSLIHYWHGVEKQVGFAMLQPLVNLRRDFDSQQGLRRCH